jgi:hypothetical protein
MNQMVNQPPRYEYRVWAEALKDAKDNLRRLGTTLGTEAREETYLISAATDSCNPKIRGGRVNIKVLLATLQGLELWNPVLEADFPLDRTVIAEQIFPALELESPGLARPSYSLEDFVEEVIRPQPRITVVMAAKRRTRFRLDECLAEFTSVALGQVARETVAIESIEPDPVLRLVREFHLDGMPNMSYVRALKQVLGDSANFLSQPERGQ